MNKIYQIKITTQEIKPPVWRTVLLPEQATFADLHGVIMDAFKFDDSHLFEFIPDKWQSVRISIIDDDPFLYDDDNVLDAASIKLAEYSDEIAKMYYVYDFGDNWEFKIELQKILDPIAGMIYPVCIKGKGGVYV